MDKYEFNIKVEQMRKMVNKGDFETAMKIADTIDWKKVRNANLLSMVATIYEKNQEYQDARDILLLAFERAPIGKRLLYKLADLALKEGNTEEAEAYYREFCDMAGDDPRQHLLRYMILREKQAPVEQMIHSLESYTAEELDERWLYELAELYHEAGDSARCVSTCDKIMLMFGLGKYVDKAMELKLQYAPLTKYQMDLVENREKYEEKLRAVEQAFEDDAPEDSLDVQSVREPEPEPVSGPAYAHPAQEPAAARQEPEPVPEIHVEQEHIAAAVKQAETERSLAQEMSRLGGSVQAEEASELEKTRVLTAIKRAPAQEQEVPVQPAEAAGEAAAAAPDTRAEASAALDIHSDIHAEMSAASGAHTETPETDVHTEAPAAAARTEAPAAETAGEEEPELPKMANHLMIEARTPEKGLEMAVQTLKQIHQETGIKNPVARITGSRLNKRGILASAEKLAGKDLVIEEAGDLSPEMLKELEKLMSQDTTGMRVILIDNPKQMEMLHAQNPALADKFECIGSDSPAAGKKAAEPAAGETSGRYEPEQDNRPVRHIVPERSAATRTPGPADYYDQDSESDAGEAADEEEMDIDEFAQYACKYASEIDCSITGKSMLALYERIEIMEEDGIPLTKTSAEELIEEAADRAEKPSVGRRIKGLFSSKYDKDGLLILKEEHFI